MATLAGDPLVHESSRGFAPAESGHDPPDAKPQPRAELLESLCCFSVSRLMPVCRVRRAAAGEVGGGQ
jgi:hypothetical protein